MSYGIIRIQKMKAGHVKGIQIHDQREKDFSHTNKDIDFSKSHLNVDLHNPEQINFTEKVRERIKSLELPKAVRKDAIVMCQCLITSDNEFFSKMNEEQQQKFFDDAFDFAKHRYGSQNIISATVHHDETTPHLHVNFVPVTRDGRLAAKDLFKKTDLHQLHDDFFKFNKNRGYNLERGETREEKRKHLEVEEYKIETGHKYIENMQEDIKDKREELQEIKKSVNASYKDVEKILKGFKHIDTVQSKKTLTGQIKVDARDYDYLYAMAKKAFVLNSKVGDLEKIAEDYNELKKKVNMGINERLETEKKMQSLRNKNNELSEKYSEIVDYVNERKLGKDFYAYRDEVEKRQQQELEQLRHHDRGMEM